MIFKLHPQWKLLSLTAVNGFEYIFQEKTESFLIFSLDSLRTAFLFMENRISIQHKAKLDEHFGLIAATC